MRLENRSDADTDLEVSQRRRERGRENIKEMDKLSESEFSKAKFLCKVHIWDLSCGGPHKGKFPNASHAHYSSAAA